MPGPERHRLDAAAADEEMHKKVRDLRGGRLQSHGIPQ